jgi:diacylglycerol kinase (ATP)
VEKHPFDGWVMVICNPVAGSGTGKSLLPRLRFILSAAGVAHVAELTRGRGHATQLARAAVLAGCSSVITIGGDGTFLEVVNGVMDPAAVGLPLSDGVAAGLILTGRGSDFGRSAGIPSDTESALNRLLAGRTMRIDLGYVSYTSFAGEARSRYFANAAGVGFDAEVSVRANAAPRLLGGTVPYLSSLFMTWGTYRNKRVAVNADGDWVWRGRATSLVVANGQYFGGGMKIAPDAGLADGEFDIVILGDLGKVDLVRNLPRVYEGSHVTHPKVSILHARYVETVSPDRLLLQADGEVLGLAPCRFQVVPSALRLIV